MFTPLPGEALNLVEAENPVHLVVRSSSPGQVEQFKKGRDQSFSKALGNGYVIYNRGLSSLYIICADIFFRISISTYFGVNFL